MLFAKLIVLTCLYLQNMTNGTMEEKDVEFIKHKCLDQLSQVERDSFNNAIHLVPQWKMAHPIVKRYLESFLTPIAKIRAKYNSCRDDGKNHCVKESSMCGRLAICVGAIVMLLRNFIVEYKLMNGSIGVVKQIVYENKEGPADRNNLPAYVIVEFSECEIPEEENLIDGRNSKCVPIPVVEDRCDKKCCSIKTIPLRVCIAITIHKSQGMTIGEGEIFEKVVVYLPEEGMRKNPGLELVAFSRVKRPEDLAIGNDSGKLTRMQIQRIGKGKIYDLRREFQQKLKLMEKETQAPTIQAITNLDTVNEPKTYEGGCAFLLDWFKEQTSIAE